MTKLTLLSLLLFSSLLCAGTTLYKFTDDNGVTHYSQTKVDDRYEAVKSQPVSIVPSVKVADSKSSIQEQEGEEISPKTLLKSFKLTAPKPDENLWGTGQTVTASVHADAALMEIYDVQYVLDGKAKPANSKATQKFSNVHRGEHKIYGQLVQKGSNRVIKKSKEVTFFIHQHSKK